MGLMAFQQRTMEARCADLGKHRQDRLGEWKRKVATSGSDCCSEPGNGRARAARCLWIKHIHCCHMNTITYESKAVHLGNASERTLVRRPVWPLKVVDTQALTFNGNLCPFLVELRRAV